MSFNGLNFSLITISGIFSLSALVLAAVGIGTPNWQVTEATINGETFIVRTANFFYACRLNTNGVADNCISRSADQNIQRYYPIDARWNQTEWIRYLDSAAGLSIIGIIFLYFGACASLFMLIPNRFLWISIFSPIFLFFACLFMFAGMASGANILYYNGYSANLYQTSHLLTIFSFLISCIVSGRLSGTSIDQTLKFSTLKQ